MCTRQTTRKFLKKAGLTVKKNEGELGYKNNHSIALVQALAVGSDRLKGSNGYGDDEFKQEARRRKRELSGCGNAG